MDKNRSISRNKKIKQKTRKKFPKDSSKNPNDISTPLAIPVQEEIIILKQKNFCDDQNEKQPQDSIRKHTSNLNKDKLKKDKDKNSLILKENEINKEENTKNISNSKNFSTSSLNNDDLTNNELLFVEQSHKENDPNNINQKQIKNSNLIINTNKINNKIEKIVAYKNRFITKLVSNKNKYKKNNRKSEGNFGSIIYQRKKKLFNSPNNNYRSIKTNESAIASISSRNMMKEEGNKENKFLKRVEEDLKKIKQKNLENSAKKNKKNFSKNVAQYKNTLSVRNKDRNSINPNKLQNKLYKNHNRLSSNNNNNYIKHKTKKEIQKTYTNTSSKRIDNYENLRTFLNEDLIHSKLVLKKNYLLKSDNSEKIEISLTSLKKNNIKKDENLVVYKPNEKNNNKEHSFSLLTEENRKQLFNEVNNDKEEELQEQKNLVNSVNNQNILPYSLNLYVEDSHSCNNFSVNNVRNEFGENRNGNRFFHFSKNNNKFRALFEKDKINAEINNNDLPENNLEKTENKNKKFKFVERNFSKNKDNYRKTSNSSEKYYDLYKKAFNNLNENNTNLEKKFSFKPRSKQKFSIKTQCYDFEENNKYFYNNLSSNNFNTINIVNIKHSSEKSSKKNINYNSRNLYEPEEKEINPFLNDKNNDSQNNKNFILDLNNVIPLDEKALIDTFTKNSIYSNRKTEIEKNEKDFIDEIDTLDNLKVDEEKISSLKKEKSNTNEKFSEKSEVKKIILRTNSPKVKKNNRILNNSKYFKNSYNTKKNKKTNYIVIDFQYESNPFKYSKSPKNDKHVNHNKIK